MKRTISKLLLFALCLVALLALSCSDEGTAARSSLHLNMDSSKALQRTLVPDDTPLSVSRYVVEGDGPQGSTFSIVSINAAVEVQGLLIGNWDLTAVGQNAQGIDLVRGTRTVSLTKEPTQAVIELDTLSGTGVMDVEFYWDSTQISDATLSVWLEDSAEVRTKLTPKVNNSANGSVQYTSTLPAGSYLLQAQLNSAEIRVAGCVEVVRIVGAKATEAHIELRLDKYSDIPNSVTLLDHLGTPIVCTIGGITESMVAQQSATATLTAEGAQPIQVAWYLDGEPMPGNQSCTFTPSSGTHRLDVIAKGALLASSGSASISFTATVDGEPGIPTLVNRVVDNTNGMNIGMGAQVAFLPDGKFLLASPTHQTLQVCRIVRDSVEVIHTYTTADSFNLAGVASLYADPLTYRVVISNSINPKVAAYQYDLTTSTLTKLFEKGNNYGSKTWGTGVFPYLYHWVVNRPHGVLMGLHPTFETAVELNLYAFSGEDFHRDGYYDTFPPGDGVRLTGMDISPSGELTVFAKESESQIIFCEWEPRLGFSFGIVTRIKESDAAFLTGVREVCFLDDTNLVYATNKDIGRFVRTGTYTWVQEEVFTSNIYKTGLLEDIIALKRTPDGTHLYALCRQSRNLAVFSFEDNELKEMGSTSLEIFNPAWMELSPSGDHLLVTSANSEELLLFRIL